MKNAVKNKTIKEGALKNTNAKKGNQAKNGELKTDYPLSEKDEVKQAEANMGKSPKKPL